FQAEDGIRVKLVTGVQTCALPIYQFTPGICGILEQQCRVVVVRSRQQQVRDSGHTEKASGTRFQPAMTDDPLRTTLPAGSIDVKIGRASCRERGQIGGGAGAENKK